MTCEEYREWAMVHIDAFGFRDQNAKCLLTWETAFSKLFTSIELHEATADMLGRADIKSFASDQRPQIIATITAARRRRESQRKVPTRDQWIPCSHCAGSGFVIVPHPMKDDQGNLNLRLKYPHEDPYNRDLSVTCLCDKGQRSHAGIIAMNRACMTFEDYRERYPEWLEVLQSRAEVRQAEFEGPKQDFDWERVKRDLANRTRMPRRAG